MQSVFFLLNPLNNWFCNRHNSIVLFVALTHLLQHRLMWWDFSKFGFIIQIALVFILKFHLNSKGANAQSLSYCSKSVAAESKCQFYLYYHKFIDFCSLNNWNLWFTGLLHLLQHRQMWWAHNVWRLRQLFILRNYLTLVPQTSEQVKLSISCSQNVFAENSYYFFL